MSDSESSRGRSNSKEKLETHKLFVTNLDGSANEGELKAELTECFQKYGTLDGQISVKKSKTGDYYFAFVVYQKGENSDDVVDKLNGTQILGKKMKVEFQNDQKRRKDSDKGCYTCGKKGHFARECRSGRDGRRDTYRGYRGRSRSDSRSDDRRRKRKHRRSRSDSSDRSRSRTKHKKDKSKKSHKQKKDKKQKKRRRSSSRSYS